MKHVVEARLPQATLIIGEAYSFAVEKRIAAKYLYENRPVSVRIYSGDKLKASARLNCGFTVWHFADDNGQL